MVANMAMQYGQSLVGQGREFVDKKLEKYVTMTQIKYYFAVDTRYVMKKLQLLFFPFTHSVSCCFVALLSGVLGMENVLIYLQSCFAFDFMF